MLIFVPSFRWIFHDDSKNKKLRQNWWGGGVGISSARKNPKDDRISKAKNLKINLTTFEEKKIAHGNILSAKDFFLSKFCLFDILSVDIMSVTILSVDILSVDILSHNRIVRVFIFIYLVSYV